MSVSATYTSLPHSQVAHRSMAAAFSAVLLLVGLGTMALSAPPPAKTATLDWHGNSGTLMLGSGDHEDQR